MIIWVTGMSGAGKTTLCEALFELAKPRVPELLLLDGDVVRAVFGGELGFSEPERRVQIGRIQRLAKMLDEQGAVVLVAALYAHPDLLADNRRNFSAYFEVYVRASMQLLESRDSKGLFGAKVPNVVGVDIPWHEPAHPDMTIDADQCEPPGLLAERVARSIPRLAQALETTFES